MFFTKLTVQLLLENFAYGNLTANVSALNVLDSGVLICLNWSAILFSGRVNKSVILDILFLISFILALRAATVQKIKFSIMDFFSKSDQIH